MSQSQSGQIVNATLIPAGPYGTHEDILGKGGLVTLTDTYENENTITTPQQDSSFINNQIKLLRRKRGMIVYLVQTKKYYSCQNEGSDETNGVWKREYFNGRYHYGPEAPTADDIQMGERWFDTRVGTEYTYLKISDFNVDQGDTGDYAWVDIDHMGSHIKYFYSSVSPTMGEYGEKLHLGDKWFNTQVGSEYTYLPSGLSGGIVTKFAWIDLDSPGGFFLAPVGELPELAIRFFYGEIEPANTNPVLRQGDKWYNSFQGKEYTYLPDPLFPSNLIWIPTVVIPPIPDVDQITRYFYGASGPTQGPENTPLRIGDRWFNTENGSEFTYIPIDSIGVTDINRRAWVDIDHIGSGGGGAASINLTQENLDFIVSTIAQNPSLLGFVPLVGNSTISGSLTASNLSAQGLIAGDSLSIQNNINANRVFTNSLTASSAQVNGPLSTNSLSVTNLASLNSMSSVGDVFVGGTAFISKAIKSSVSVNGGVETPELNEFITRNYAEQKFQAFKSIESSLRTKKPGYQGITGTIFSVDSFGPFIIAGGDFSSAGGTGSTGIALWDGTKWNSLNGGVNGVVKEIQKNELELGIELRGNFNTGTENWSVGDFIQIRENGSTSSDSNPIGFGEIIFVGENRLKLELGFQQAVNFKETVENSWNIINSSKLGEDDEPIHWLTLTSSPSDALLGEIFVGGTFSSPASNVAKYDFTKETWSGLSADGVQGVNGQVLSLKLFQNSITLTRPDVGQKILFIGGEFSGGITALNIDPPVEASAILAVTAAGESENLVFTNFSNQDNIVVAGVTFTFKDEENYSADVTGDVELGEELQQSFSNFIERFNDSSWSPGENGSRLFSNILDSSLIQWSADEGDSYGYLGMTGGAQFVRFVAREAGMIGNQLQISSSSSNGAFWSQDNNVFIDDGLTTLIGGIDSYSWRSVGSGVSGSVMTMDFGSISYGITFTGQFYSTDEQGNPTGPNSMDTEKWTRFSQVYITQDGTTGGVPVAIGTFDLAREIDPQPEITSSYTMYIVPQNSPEWSGLRSGWKVILSPSSEEEVGNWFELTENPLEPSQSKLTRANLFVGGNIEEVDGTAANGLGRYDVVDSSWSVPYLHEESNIVVNSLVSFFAFQERLTKLLLATNLEDNKLLLIDNSDEEGEFGDYKSANFPFTITGNVNRIYGLGDLTEDDILGEVIQDKTDFLIVGDFDFVTESSIQYKTGKMFLIDADIDEDSKTYVKYMYNDSVMGEIHAVCRLSDSYAVHGIVDFNDIPLCVGGNFSSTDMTISATSSASGPSNLAIWNAQYFQDISTVSQPRYLTSLPFGLFNHNDANPSENGQISKLSHGFCGRIVKREIPVVLDKGIGVSYDWESLKFGSNPSIGRYSNVLSPNILFSPDGGFHEFVKIKNFKRTTPVNASLSEAAKNSCTLVNGNEIWIDDKWFHTNVGGTQGKGYSLNIHLFEVP
jgi:hypothetical protein